MDDRHARACTGRRVHAVLPAPGQKCLQVFAHPVDPVLRAVHEMGQHGHPMRPLQVRRKSHAELLRKDSQDLAGHVALLDLVDDVSSGMEKPDLPEEPFAEVMEIAHIRQRPRSALRHHAFPHLEGRPIGECRAEHAFGRHTTRERRSDALRQHLRLPGSRRRQDQMPPLGNLHNRPLLVRQIHVGSLLRPLQHFRIHWTHTAKATVVKHRFAKSFLQFDYRTVERRQGSQ